MPAVAQTSPNRGGGSFKPSITPLMKSWNGRGRCNLAAERARCALLLSDDGGGDLNTADVDDELAGEAAVAAAAVLCCWSKAKEASTKANGEIPGTLGLDSRRNCNM